MHIRSRALAAALAASLVFATAACGDDSDVAATDTAESTTTDAPADSTTTSSTTTTTTTTAAPAAEPAGAFAAGSPEAAAAEAYAVVFDSTKPLEEKAPYLEDADALAPTIAAYAQTGERFGGISLKPTAVTIDGTTATITYDVYFGTAKQYGGLTGSISQDGGTWRVSRDEFCGFMTSAHTPCAS